MSAAIELDNPQAQYRPGEEISGKVSWHLDTPPESASVLLYWYTEGKGDQDNRVVAEYAQDAPEADDRRTFAVTAPPAPYSFSGKLISLIWTVRLDVKSPDESASAQITISPTGTEVLLLA